jgi:hypothetical protein
MTANRKITVLIDILPSSGAVDFLAVPRQKARTHTSEIPASTSIPRIPGGTVNVVNYF